MTPTSLVMEGDGPFARCVAQKHVVTCDAFITTVISVKKANALSFIDLSHLQS
jgi:hypothetical protein